MPAEPSDLPPAEIRWHFGSFVLLETQRRLERSGRVVRLGPRSFDLLLQLVKLAGEFVSKDQLLSSVWAGVVVEEGSVRVHMSTLRKALGEPQDSDGCKEWISNVPSRGYRFNGRVGRDVDTGVRIRTRPQGPTFTKLPIRVTELVGRDADVEDVVSSLDIHRLVTIVGTGGIGKTSIAVRVAEIYQQKHAIETALVDLAPLISQDHVLSTMARSVGAAADLPDAVEVIAQSLTGRDVLWLIDNCEHVLDALALPITGLLAALPGLRILATSREALRLPGEYVFRLPTLAVPEAECLTLAQALQWPAVKLFVERARAAGAGAFNDSHGQLLARISRQLDGIPLAIELVAARLGAQSVSDLALRLDDRLRLSSAGGRAARSRHKTLAAALDWSIALLNEQELRLFRRLSVFRGRFDAESALYVTVGDMDPDVAFDVLISLTSKSLVSFDGNDAVAPYRLLDTTRSYAESLLAQSEERPALLRRHGLLMLDVMKAATAELPKLNQQAWGDRYAHRLDDVRFALEVCLVQEPDAEAAAALIAASAPLWFHVSQVEEYRDRVAATLALVERQPEPDMETATSLNTALITALLHTGGSVEDLNAACDRALAGALATKVPVLELKARWARCTHDMFRGEYTAALRDSETLLPFAQSWSDPAALVLSHRVCAMANHFCGRFELSRQHSALALDLSTGMGRSHANMVGPDTICAAKAVLCRTLWIQGETTKALRTASDAVARAESIGHAVSLCAALYGACVVALWSGELELARRWVHVMMEEAQRRGLVGWLRYAHWYSQGLQLHFKEDPSHHIREVSDRFSLYDAPCKEVLVTFCLDWVDDGMVTRISRGEGEWSAAEVWRAVGLRSEQRGDTEEAENFYLRAIETARRQGAVAWELRAAIQLAEMWSRMNRRQQAAQLLDETCARAPPDSENASLTQAQRLRAELTFR
jgi:predicted ATPase/DNA-binding winged helix-turn-helix (wHTH) protein